MLPTSFRVSITLFFSDSRKCPEQLKGERRVKVEKLQLVLDLGESF
jgi:hypothetical protein